MKGEGWGLVSGRFDDDDDDDVRTSAIRRIKLTTLMLAMLTGQNARKGRLAGRRRRPLWGKEKSMGCRKYARVRAAGFDGVSEGRRDVLDGNTTSFCSESRVWFFLGFREIDRFQLSTQLMSSVITVQ